MKRIAVFGGSINPPCEHHRRMAARLAEVFDEVFVIPCGPHFDMTRYGVFAARAKDRGAKREGAVFSSGRVVPGPPPKEPEPTQLQLVLAPGLGPQAKPPDEGSTKPASRHPWAWLLQRVFAVEVPTVPSMVKGA